MSRRNETMDGLRQTTVRQQQTIDALLGRVEEHDKMARAAIDQVTGMADEQVRAMHHDLMHALALLQQHKPHEQEAIQLLMAEIARQEVDPVQRSTAEFFPTAVALIGEIAVTDWPDPINPAARSLIMGLAALCVRWHTVLTREAHGAPAPKLTTELAAPQYVEVLERQNKQMEEEDAAGEG